MDKLQATEVVTLSVSQMQHINALFAMNPDATHVVVYEKEDKDGDNFTTTAKIGFTETADSSNKKKSKTTTRYLEEVVLANV